MAQGTDPAGKVEGKKPPRFSLPIYLMHNAFLAQFLNSKRNLEKFFFSFRQNFSYDSTKSNHFPWFEKNALKRLPWLNLTNYENGRTTIRNDSSSIRAYMKHGGNWWLAIHRFNRGSCDSASFVPIAALPSILSLLGRREPRGTSFRFPDRTSRPG